MACHFRCLSKHGGVLGPRKQCQFCLWDTPLIGEFGFLVVVLVGGKHTAEIHAEIQQTKKKPASPQLDSFLWRRTFTTPKKWWNMYARWAASVKHPLWSWDRSVQRSVANKKDWELTKHELDIASSGKFLLTIGHGELVYKGCQGVTIYLDLMDDVLPPKNRWWSWRLTIQFCYFCRTVWVQHKCSGVFFLCKTWSLQNNSEIQRERERERCKSCHSFRPLSCFVKKNIDLDQPWAIDRIFFNLNSPISSFYNPRISSLSMFHPYLFFWGSLPSGKVAPASSFPGLQICGWKDSSTAGSNGADGAKKGEPEPFFDKGRGLT